MLKKASLSFSVIKKENTHIFCNIQLFLGKIEERRQSPPPSDCPKGNPFNQIFDATPKAAKGMGECLEEAFTSFGGFTTRGFYDIMRIKKQPQLLFSFVQNICVCIVPQNKNQINKKYRVHYRQKIASCQMKEMGIDKMQGFLV